MVAVLDKFFFWIWNIKGSYQIKGITDFDPVYELLFSQNALGVMNDQTLNANQPKHSFLIWVDMYLLLVITHLFQKMRMLVVYWGFFLYT